MSRQKRGDVWLPLLATALVLGICAFSSPWSPAYGGDLGPDGPVARDPGYGTLGYGSPGLVPGFPGFGLSYHRGYGYGGDALGTGINGGFPNYGGPGYPHPEPRLRRFGGITPFPYFGGLGYPCNGRPNVYGAVGPLVVERPVVFETETTNLGFGPLTGALPYPETLFAPYALPDTSTGASDRAGAPSVEGGVAPDAGPGASSAFSSPLTAEMSRPRAQPRDLGLDEEPVVDAGGVPGIKLTKVDPYSTAGKAGLQAGDVIHSINGYLTTQRGNLAWIMAHAASDNILKMNVRKAIDGKEQTVIVPIP